MEAGEGAGGPGKGTQAVQKEVCPASARRADAASVGSPGAGNAGDAVPHQLFPSSNLFYYLALNFLSW